MSGLGMHLSSLFISLYKINVRSIVLCVPLACQVIVLLLVTSSNEASRAMSSRMSAAACYVSRDIPFQSGWWRLRSPTTMWSVRASLTQLRRVSSVSDSEKEYNDRLGL
jgi:hypothetical protein